MIVKLGALVAPNATAEAPVNPLPATDTVVPPAAAPEAGEIAVTTGTPDSSQTLRPNVPTRKSGGLAAGSNASEVQSTVGSRAPSGSQFVPPSSVRRTPPSLATMIGCGVIVRSMTTECSGRSGRLFDPPALPLMSVQFAPLFVVLKT
jgi:hypothetical protein